MKNRKALFRKFSIVAISMFGIMNLVAALHAYSFTHFSDSSDSRTSEAGEISGWEKFSALISGVRNPRPENNGHPAIAYETIYLQSNTRIEAWRIRADSSLGTVIIGHGYGGSKSTMMDKANAFLEMHYSVLLIDFMGCGGSEGNQCTIGYFESSDITAAYQFLVNEGENNIVLFGTSMGAVASMKAVSEDSLKVSAMILECPFGSMYKTTCARFNMMNIPSFPMAGLLVFWGGVENGFWAFDHNPTEYSKQISCPALVFYGEKDPKVSREETDEIFSNLQGKKQLTTFPEAGHENYFTRYYSEWNNAVQLFLSETKH